MKQKEKNMVIVSLLVLTLIMIVGYSAFNANLKIRGVARVSTRWNVMITQIDVNKAETTGEGVSKATTLGESGLSAVFESSLTSPGDTVTYDVTIENKGEIEAKLDDMILEQKNIGTGVPGEKLTPEQIASNPIVYSYKGIEKDDVLPVSEQKTFQVVVQYNPNAHNQPLPEQMKSSLVMTLSYVQNVKG